MDLKTLTERHREYLLCIDKINEYYHFIGAPPGVYTALMSAQNVAHERYLSLRQGLIKEITEKQQKTWEAVKEKTGGD